MLVTDGGQLIRCPVDGIRIAGRSTQGVIVFSTAEGERVVSVERLTEEGEENGEVERVEALRNPSTAADGFRESSTHPTITAITHPGSMPCAFITATAAGLLRNFSRSRAASGALELALTPAENTM